MSMNRGSSVQGSSMRNEVTDPRRSTGLVGVSNKKRTSIL